MTFAVHFFYKPFFKINYKFINIVKYLFNIFDTIINLQEKKYMELKSSTVELT